MRPIGIKPTTAGTQPSRLSGWHMGDDGSGSAPGPSAALQQLDAIGLVELLEHNGRPTFILDLEARVDDTKLEPVFCNTSLRSSPGLQEVVFGTTQLQLECGLRESRTYSDFKGWALNSAGHTVSADGNSLGFVYDGVVWTSFVLRERWRLISGNHVQRVGSALTVPVGSSSHTDGPSTAEQRESYPSQAIHLPTDTVQPRSSATKLPAWVKLLPSSPHTNFFLDIDWSATELGPLQSWSYRLRQMTIFLMSDPRPAAMYWSVA